MTEYVDLPYKFTPRPYQQPFLDYMYAPTPIRKRAILVWHRRAGKDKTAFNWLVMYAILNKGVYYYLFPSYSQGRKVVWDNIDDNGIRLLEHIPKCYIEKVNKVQMQIELKNGSLIQILGTDDYDALRGVNCHGIILSEYAEHDPRAYDVIRPVVDNNDSPVVFVFTPKGQNHAKDLFDRALTNKDWFVSKLSVSDTGVKSPADIDRIREEGMSDDMIQQEWYVSFTLGIEGSYYAKYIEQAREEKRIGNVPHDPSAEVHTSIDRGFANAAITFFQIIGNEVHIIEYYESHKESLKEHIAMIKAKPYTYGYHFAPHDFDMHEYNMGQSGKELGAKLGIDFTILPRELRLAREEGIESVRGLMPRLWINRPKCELLIKALENYRREFNDKLNKYAEKPLHDWSSHGADSVRYMAQGIKLHLQQSKGPTLADTTRMWERNNPRFR